MALENGGGELLLMSRTRLMEKRWEAKREMSRTRLIRKRREQRGNDGGGMLDGERCQNDDRAMTKQQGIAPTVYNILDEPPLSKEQ